MIYSYEPNLTTYNNITHTILYNWIIYPMLNGAPRTFQGTETQLQNYLNTLPQ